MANIYNFSTRINILTTIEFGKITSSFSLSMSNFWICYGVLCVSWVAIVLCPFSPMELRHKIFNRSHLNLKLRLGPVFFHSSPFLQFAYTIYLKNMFDIQGQKYKLHSYHVIQLRLCLQLLSTVFLECIHFTKHLSAYTKLSWI